MDIIEIDGASNPSVNDVRQIRDEVLFPPNAGRYKIYIIDEVHMLSNSAFNALLKTIEEPPPYIVFIFATTELHKVPATIKSRCQQFSFRLIPIETITAILKETCAELSIDAEDEALFWIARESTGSLRDAYTLFDQVASFSGGNIRAALIREKLGLVGFDKLTSLAEACAANDTPAAFALVDELLDGGVAIEQFVIDLAGYYRSLLLLKNGVTRESLLGYAPGRFPRAVLEKLDPVHLERALDLLLNLYRDIRYSVSPRFELETAVSKLSWLDRWISPAELRETVAGLRRSLGTGGAPASGGGGSGGGSGGSAGSGGVTAAAQNGGGTVRETRETREVYDRPGSPAPGSLAEEFQRHLASRTHRADGRETADGTPEPGYGAPVTEEQLTRETSAAFQPENRGGTVPPQVEVVRQVFNGTLIEGT
jgi:DNA polymerase-3 subunit gamma/tau